MAEQDRTVLKSYFEIGDRPTQSNFSDLIDSTYNKVEDVVDSLPIQSLETSGMYLKSDGVSADWDVIQFPDGLPSQIGNDGKILRTTGTSAVWVDNYKEIKIIDDSTLNVDGMYHVVTEDFGKILRLEIQLSSYPTFKIVLDHPDIITSNDYFGVALDIFNNSGMLYTLYSSDYWIKEVNGVTVNSPNWTFTSDNSILYSAVFTEVGWSILHNSPAFELTQTINGLPVSGNPVLTATDVSATPKMPEIPITTNEVSATSLILDPDILYLCDTSLNDIIVEGFTGDVGSKYYIKILSDNGREIKCSIPTLYKNNRSTGYETAMSDLPVEIQSFEKTNYKGVEVEILQTQTGIWNVIKNTGEPAEVSHSHVINADEKMDVVSGGNDYDVLTLETGVPTWKPSPKEIKTIDENYTGTLSNYDGSGNPWMYYTTGVSADMPDPNAVDGNGEYKGRSGYFYGVTDDPANGGGRTVWVAQKIGGVTEYTWYKNDQLFDGNIFYVATDEYNVILLQQSSTLFLPHIHANDMKMVSVGGYSSYIIPYEGNTDYSFWHGVDPVNTGVYIRVRGINISMSYANGGWFTHQIGYNKNVDDGLAGGRIGDRNMPAGYILTPEEYTDRITSPTASGISEDIDGNVQTAINNLRLSGSSVFSVTFPARAFNNIGVNTEPIFTILEMSFFTYPALMFVSTTAYSSTFIVPSNITNNYTDGNNINIDIEYILSGTISAGTNIVFGCGLTSIPENSSVNVNTPTSGAGFGSVDILLSGTEGMKQKSTITLDANLWSPQLWKNTMWIGKLTRYTNLDNCPLAAYVTSITVY